MQRRRPQQSLPFLTAAAPQELTRPPPSSRKAAADDESIPVISVGELDRRLKRLVEGETTGVRVEGEISGLHAASSGHAYFTLKDAEEEAAIDCVMYRSAPARSRRLLEEGARVILIGRATIYAPRGRLQLVADEARPVGRGALLEALERLKEKLAAEGLFAPERKRPVPAEARVIGVVTSAQGAAIHDIIKVAFRRGAVRIVLSPALVQGPTAASQMVRALALLERVPEVEVIILGRGGGSADDLSAFNDEMLVRQVAATRVPVVSAVGHEIDLTLTDLVADARAATPSQAAELLVPDAEARAETLAHLEARLHHALEQRFDTARGELERLERRLGTPERLIALEHQRIDDLLERIEDHTRELFARRRAEIVALDRRLTARHPRALVADARAELGPLEVRLGAAMRERLAEARSTLGERAARLDELSPLAVLGRGYAIATRADGRAVRDAREVALGEQLRLRVHKGALVAEVRGVEEERDDGATR